MWINGNIRLDVVGYERKLLQLAVHTKVSYDTWLDKGGSVRVTKDITVLFVRRVSGGVRLGIDAPKEIKVSQERSREGRTKKPRLPRE